MLRVLRGSGNTDFLGKQGSTGKAVQGYGEGIPYPAPNASISKPLKSNLNPLEENENES